MCNAIKFYSLICIQEITLFSIKVAVQRINIKTLKNWLVISFGMHILEK